MLKRYCTAGLVALTLLLGTNCRADSNADLRRALTRFLPDLPASTRIVKTPYGGLYEIDLGTQVFYTDVHGSFLIDGEILDTRSGINVTKARIEQLQKVDWKQLPLKDAFTIVYGNGQRQVASFEDPYCPYCKKMDQTLAEVGNLTVHVFLLPVIRDDSPVLSRDIWCSADPARAWQAWMSDKTAPAKAAAGCATPLDANLALAQRLGIQSTPTLILDNGQRLTGAVDAAEFKRRQAQH